MFRSALKFDYKSEDTIGNAISDLIGNIHSGAMTRDEVYDAIKYLDNKFPNQWKKYDFSSVSRNSDSIERLPKTEWDKKYFENLVEWAINGARSKELLIHMAEVHDYVYGGIGTAIKSKRKQTTWYGLRKYEDFSNLLNDAGDLVKEIYKISNPYTEVGSNTSLHVIEEKCRKLDTTIEMADSKYKELVEYTNSTNFKIRDEEYHSLYDKIEKDGRKWEYLVSDMEKIVKYYDDKRNYMERVEKESKEKLEEFNNKQKIISNTIGKISQIAKMTNELSILVVKFEII